MTTDIELTKRISLIIQNEINGAGPYAASTPIVVKAISDSAAIKIVEQIPDNSIDAVEARYREVVRRWVGNE